MLDPSGNFMISVQDGKIIVDIQHLDLEKLLTATPGKSASQLYRQISADCLVFKLNTLCI